MKIRVVILLVLFLAFGWAQAFGQDAVINNVVITKYQNSVYVYFTLDDPFSPELVEAIKGGIETTFTFYVVLKQHRGGILRDPEIVERTIRHTIKYDTLLQEYTVVRDEEGKRPFVTKDFDTAKRIVARVKFYPLVTLTMLEKGNTYRLEIKGELDKGEIPKSLHYVLFFGGVWNLQTPWYVEEFVY
jgi:hypothetical protein